MSMKIEITGIPALDMQEIFKELCPLVITEMKRLLMSGHDLDNKPMKKRENNDNPYFYDTGKTLNSLSYEVSENGFTIFFAGKENELVAYYLNNRFEWLITKDKSYIDSFIEKELDQIIQRKLDTK